MNQHGVEVTFPLRAPLGSFKLRFLKNAILEENRQSIRNRNALLATMQKIDSRMQPGDMIDVNAMKVRIVKSELAAETAISKSDEIKASLFD